MENTLLVGLSRQVTLERQLGDSQLASRVAAGVDLDWWYEFAHDGAVPSFRLSIIGGAAPVSTYSELLDGENPPGGVGAAMLAAGPLLARSPKAPAAGWFDRAIVIDGLGGLNDPYTEGEISRLSDRAFAEMMQTGVTVLRDTVMPVGNGTDNWGDYKKDVELKQNILNANPDRLILVRTAADILKAKREKKFGVLLGTQDTAMVGPDLDRLAEMKKDVPGWEHYARSVLHRFVYRADKDFEVFNLKKLTFNIETSEVQRCESPWQGAYVLARSAGIAFSSQFGEPSRDHRGWEPAYTDLHSFMKSTRHPPGKLAEFVGECLAKKAWP